MLDLNNMFDELNKEHFDGRISKIPAKWNNRMRTAAGYCKFKRDVSGNLTPIRIDLSKKLFANEDWDPEKIKRTMIHEMTHAFLIEHHNEKGHSQRFQSIMTKITGERVNHRCHNYNVSGLRNKRSVIAECPKCGEVGRRSRLPNAGLVYKCVKCKSRVSWKREVSISKSPTFKPLF